MIKEEIAKILLENKAITLNAKEPYTYASGIRSPIYCDNRLMLGAIEDREIIIDAFVQAIKDLDLDIVAGTSTAGIPWAAWISEKLKKPMCYIRSGKKGHGKSNLIEGAKVSGKKLVIIEDLISTSGSSFSAVKAARDEGAIVTHCLAIFTYGFEKAKNKFSEGNCEALTLTDFTTLVNVAKENDYLTEDELNLVLEWNKNPAEWGPNNGFPNAVRD